jgi:hypothetical protein
VFVVAEFCCQDSRVLMHRTLNKLYVHFIHLPLTPGQHDRYDFGCSNTSLPCLQLLYHYITAFNRIFGPYSSSFSSSLVSASLPSSVSHTPSPPSAMETLILTTVHLDLIFSLESPDVTLVGLLVLLWVPALSSLLFGSF